MTAAEFEQEFLIAYDKVSNFAAPGYDQLEISTFLTSGQERLVKRRYNYKGNKYGEGFEGTEKRRKDLSELVKGPTDNSGSLLTQVSSNQNGVRPNGVFYDLPTDIMYVISEEVVTDQEDCSVVPNLPTTRVNVKPITHDEYTANIKNPFKRPYSELVWRMDVSRENAGTGAKRHELITDGSYSILNYPIRYIKRPRPIIVADISALGTIEGISSQQTSELDESFHREIINEAVQIALETTQEPRQQTQAVQTQLTE